MISVLDSNLWRGECYKYVSKTNSDQLNVFTSLIKYDFIDIKYTLTFDL